MTSQRDETVGHVAGDEMGDDPIVIERHDEILGGPPVDDPEADDAPARDAAAEDSAPADDELATGRPAGDELAGDDLAGDDLATDEPASDEPAGDELTGRHAAPEADSAELEQDAPPLLVPPGPAPGDPVAPGEAAASGAETAVPAPGAPGTPGASPVDAGPVATAPAGAGTPAASASEPASANGDGVPAAALAGQQWPAIQAMFVDDPKGSVERAAAAADEVAKAFVASLQREQTALRAAWEKDTTTEDLRTALQQYRAFCGRLEGLA
jgi:hypothetical protein